MRLMLIVESNLLPLYEKLVPTDPSGFLVLSSLPVRSVSYVNLDFNKSIPLLSVP